MIRKPQLHPAIPKLSIIVLLVSFAALASASSTAQHRTSGEQATTELVFGALLPLTGAWSSSGTASQAALEIAIADINQYLSSAKSMKRIRLVVQNTETDPDIALQKLRDLSRQGIRMVIGPQSSAEVRVIKDFADNNGILIISQSSTAGSLAIPGDNIFRFTQDDSYEGPAVAYLMREDGIQAVIPMWRADAGNDGLQSATRSSFLSLGGSVSSGVRYSAATQDFTPELGALRPQVSDAIKKYGADAVAVYLAAFGEVNALFDKARKDPELASIRWYGSDGNAQNDAISNSADVAQFALKTGFPNPIPGLVDEARGKWEPVLRQIRAKIGRDPDTFALAAYDALWVTALTTLAAGDAADTKILKGTLVQTAKSFDGTTGSCELNEAGDRKYGNFEFWAVKEDHGIFQWISESKYVTDPGRPGRLTRNATLRFFPFFQGNTNSISALAAANPSSKTAALQFSAYDQAGQLLGLATNPANFILSPKNLLSRLGFQLFGEAANSIQFGWVQLSSDVPTIGSLLQFGWSRQLTGSLPYLFPRKKFYFTRAVEGRTAYRGQSATTFISLANPTDRPVTLKLRLLGGPGTSVRQQTLTLSSKGFYFAPLLALFGSSLSLTAAYIEVEVIDGDGALGLELIRLNRQNTLIALDAQYGNAFSSSYSNLLFSGPGNTANLKLINVGSATRLVSISATDNSGRTLAAPVQINLAAGASYELDIEQVFGLPAETTLTGALRVETTDSGIIGDIIVTETRSFGSAAGSSLQARTFSKAIFSTLSGAEDITPSLAVFNPGATDADLTIEVYAEDGQMSGAKKLQVLSGGRLYDSLARLVPESSKLKRGYILIDSSRPVMAHEVFVDGVQHIKSAVPPTILKD